MEPRIVEKGTFTVVGLPFAGPISSGPYEDGQSNHEIGPAWEEFNRRCAETRHICGPAIGLCIGMPGDADPWYVAGIEVGRAEEAPDFELYDEKWDPRDPLHSEVTIYWPIR
jgi:predicted transcriptional regulator YdeE